MLAFKFLCSCSERKNICGVRTDMLSFESPKPHLPKTVITQANIT